MTNNGQTHSARTPLEWAQSIIGVREATGNNDGPDVDVFTGGRREPWCAHFVAWCFRMAGKPLPGDVVPTPTRANPIASVATMERRLKAACLDEKRGDGVWASNATVNGKRRATSPSEVVFFKSRVASDPGRGRHVGIVERYNAATETVHTIEGNTANGVRRRAYHVDDTRIAGYGVWP
jgi:hypothetical protein